MEFASQAVHQLIKDLNTGFIFISNSVVPVCMFPMHVLTFRPCNRESIYFGCLRCPGYNIQFESVGRTWILCPARTVSIYIYLSATLLRSVVEPYAVLFLYYVAARAGRNISIECRSFDLQHRSYVCSQSRAQTLL
jgi:hypothetical protein